MVQNSSTSAENNIIKGLLIIFFAKKHVLYHFVITTDEKNCSKARKLEKKPKTAVNAMIYGYD